MAPRLPPVVITAAALSPTQIEVNFSFGNGIPFVREFELESADHEDEPFHPLTAVAPLPPANSTSRYVHNGLSPGQVVFYRARVRTFYDGHTEWSATVQGMAGL